MTRFLNVSLGQRLTQRLMTAIFFLSATTVGCGGGGSGESDDASARACSVVGLPSRIIGGNTCADTSSSSLARVMAIVEVEGTLANIPVCTGTLVTPDTILTAAHCITPNVDGLPVVGLGAYFGEAGSGTFVSAVGLSVPDSYRFDPATERLFEDAALLRLERAVSNPVMPILLSRIPQVGESGFVYGYGAREQGDTAAGRDFTLLQAGAMTIETVTQNHIFVGFNGNGVNVCNGDSGGPIIVLVDGQPALAGIVSQGNQVGCASGDITTFTNVHSPGVFPWLVERIPNAYTRSNTSKNTPHFFTLDEILN